MGEAGKAEEKAARAEKLKAYDKELSDAVRREDPLESMDIYEEMERLKMMTPRHLLGMGECLLKLRRRQDAREAWLRATEIDREFEPVLEALDQFFPGWKKAIEKKRLEEVRKKKKKAAAPKAKPAEAAPAPPAGGGGARSPGGRPAVPTASAVAPTMSARPMPNLDAESTINWGFVLEDLGIARIEGLSSEMPDLETPDAEASAGDTPETKASEEAMPEFQLYPDEAEGDPE